VSTAASPVTHSQLWAQQAYERVSARKGRDGEADYLRFSKRFPSLIHTCGLAQALAFAEAKNQDAVLSDLAEVLRTTAARLAEDSRNAKVPAYLRLSRDSLAAATWLKRYAEAILKDPKGTADASLS
jgi:CRISPR-associated protein Cmr5